MTQNGFGRFRWIHSLIQLLISNRFHTYQKESILKNAKSIPKIAGITADIGAKSALNRRIVLALVWTLYLWLTCLRSNSFYDN